MIAVDDVDHNNDNQQKTPGHTAKERHIGVVLTAAVPAGSSTINTFKTIDVSIPNDGKEWHVAGEEPLSTEKTSTWKRTTKTSPNKNYMPADDIGLGWKWVYYYGDITIGCLESPGQKRYMSYDLNTGSVSPLCNGNQEFVGLPGYPVSFTELKRFAKSFLKREKLI